MQNNSVLERFYINDFHRQSSLAALRGGGTIHVIASLLAGAEVGTDQLTAPEHSFKREQQLGKVQEKRIESWAKKTGCWVDDTSVYNQTLGDKTHQN